MREPTPVPAVPDRIPSRPLRVDRTIHFYTDADRQVRWHVKAANGQTTSPSSQGYSRFIDAAREAATLYGLPVADVRTGHPGIVRVDPSGVRTVWAIVQDDDDA